MNKKTKEQMLLAGFYYLIEDLRQFSRRLDLSEPQCNGAESFEWYGMNIGTYLTKDAGEVIRIFWFDHPNLPESYSKGDRSGKHMFRDYRQCMQSLTQHLTFMITKDIYDQREL